MWKYNHCTTPVENERYKANDNSNPILDRWKYMLYVRNMFTPKERTLLTLVMSRISILLSLNIIPPLIHLIVRGEGEPRFRTRTPMFFHQQYLFQSTKWATLLTHKDTYMAWWDWELMRVWLWNEWHVTCDNLVICKEIEGILKW